MKKVLVFGSLNMDLTIECDVMPQAGETLEGRGFLTNPGGKGGNQAVAAAKLGAPTYMIGRIGADLFGRQLKTAMEEYGVNCAYLSESTQNNTGVAIIMRCEGDNRIILSPGSNHEMGSGDVHEILDKIGEPGDIFITQYECDASAVIGALAAAKQKHLFTLFNPAPAKAIPTEAYANIDLIVVNQTECEFLSGIYPTDEATCQEALQRFSDMGAGGAVITLGSHGSACRIGEKIVRVDSYSVPNVDTTAAGDAYIGALASALVQGEHMENCMRFATKAAALTITKQGAQQAIPYRNEIDAYFEEESV